MGKQNANINFVKNQKIQRKDWNCDMILLCYIACTQTIFKQLRNCSFTPDTVNPCSFWLCSETILYFQVL